MTKIEKFFKDHKREIITGIFVGVVVAGGATLIIRSKNSQIFTLENDMHNLHSEIDSLKEINESLHADNIKKGIQILDLKDLCMAKDEAVLPLAADDLRRGGPLGGQFLAGRKAYLHKTA